MLCSGICHMPQGKHGLVALFDGLAICESPAPRARPLRIGFWGPQ